MSESQVELMVERKIDRLDQAFLNGTITSAEYDAKIEEIYEWAESQYTRG